MIRLRAAGLGLSALLLAACTAQPSASVVPSSSAAPSASPVPSTSSAPGLPAVASPDDYYPSAEEVAATAPGAIIRALEIQAPQGMRAWFVVYGSTGLDGKPVAVSEMILAPEPPPAGSGYPIVAWAHGTTGVADQCAPSKEGVTAIRSELQALVAQGYVVAATDYEGLGTDGIHPYLVGVSEGRSIVDSILAAMALPDAHAGGPAVVIGHSQGGHAALWAAELAPTYAPDLPLLGVFAASPPTDMVAWETWAFDQAASGVISPAAAPLLLFGVWNGIYDAPLGFLTNEGRQSALAGRDGCFPTDVNSTPYLSDPARNAEWRNLLARNSPGGVGTTVPIRVVSPEADEAVDYHTQLAGMEAMCAVGDTVELWTVGGDHDASIWTPSAWPEAVTWINDRFAGVAAVSTCGA